MSAHETFPVRHDPGARPECPGHPANELEAAIRRVFGETAAEPLPAQLVELVKMLAARRDELPPG